nr:unnamed protein product [Callosobruchus chinensis]
MAVIRRLFPNRLISRFGDLLWPHRTSDLSICGFFYGVPQVMCFTRSISQINRDMLEKVERNFRERLQQCINENGHHMPEQKQIILLYFKNTWFLCPTLYMIPIFFG